jgi:hypothetical protein
VARKAATGHQLLAEAEQVLTEIGAEAHARDIDVDARLAELESEKVALAKVKSLTSVVA